MKSKFFQKKNDYNYKVITLIMPKLILIHQSDIMIKRWYDLI